MDVNFPIFFIAKVWHYSQFMWQFQLFSMFVLPPFIDPIQNFRFQYKMQYEFLKFWYQLHQDVNNINASKGSQKVIIKGAQKDGQKGG